MQDDRFDAAVPVTICLFTTAEVDAPLFRLAVDPTGGNGLAERSYLMIDTIVTVARERVGRTVGRLSPADLLRMDRALVVFLGLAG